MKNSKIFSFEIFSKCCSKNKNDCEFRVLCFFCTIILNVHGNAEAESELSMASLTLIQKPKSGFPFIVSITNIERIGNKAAEFIQI